ncbi:MAG TPA: peptidase U32 family protein [Candidatus Woesearchaeota archaeon]|nr:peptidase U32 family protein [Candidatus Woesearchaeota archaeon]
MKTSGKKVEIMSPAGSFESLIAAIKAGADSIYFGAGELNMRSGSIRFSVSDLVRIVRICKKNNVRCYLTLNSVMFDDDLNQMKKICIKAKKAGVDSIIACDFSVIEFANQIGLKVHLSTQANVSNFEAVRFFSRYADTIVLARELSLAQIDYICKMIQKNKLKGPSGKLVEIEVFVHGALCVAVSGKCYMSLAQYNSSANRGKCLQACRRRYRIIDDETNDELVVDNNFIMSPKDLCTIAMIDKLIESGVSVFKIEGRARAPEYVYTVTKIYKEAVLAVENKSYSPFKVAKWKKELNKVFNRGFWENGYYLGKKNGEWANAYGSVATTEKLKIGKVIHFYGKNKIAQIYIESNGLSLNDKIMISGKTTGPVFLKVENIVDFSGKVVNVASKGMKVTIPIKEKVRINDEVFLFRDRISYQ